MTTFTLRRLVAIAAAALAALCCGTADAAPAVPQPAFDASAPSYRLWPDRAPGAGSDGETETPRVTVIRPSVQWGNGSAVVIAPGGGYVGLSLELEGAQPAQWFASRGVTAFVLSYRLEPTMLPNPLLDGARAIRFVRAHAAAFGIDPKRIGLMGFSAGGHLAAMEAARSDAGDAHAADPIERASSRPDFLVLGYPWLETTIVGKAGTSPYCEFARKLAHAPCVEGDYTAFLPVRLVRPGGPPTFIYHTTSDTVVPVEGSVRYYLALRQAGVPAELHAFETSDHGSGMGGADPSLSQWPILLQEWLRLHGMLPPPGKGDAWR